jgi:photosystem II stability/assembly factor-like uncharacterized protein
VRGKLDRRIDRRVKGKLPPKPAGGKALRRLFAYLAERDPALTSDAISDLVVPGANVPAFALGRRMTAAQAARTLAKPVRRRRVSPAAKNFALAITKGAQLLVKPLRRRSGRGKRALVAPAPGAAGPAAPPVWQSIGPTVIPNGQTYGTNRVDVIGRVAAIAVDPKNAKHILLGAADGGIWESKDGGTTWSPRTDSMPSLAIGAITFHPTNANTVYAGSGEGNFYASLGAGVYRSTDGGTTWTVLASAPFMGSGFFDLVVDPKTPSTLYAATTSGFYKSTNGGSTWTVKRTTRCWDISVHPGGGGVELLAAFQDGIFVSKNSGNSFSPVTLPQPPAAAWTRLGVDRVAASPDVAYVFGAAGAAFLWRRSGTAWSRIALPTSPTNLRIDINQAWYDWYVAATPDNAGQVFLGAIDTLRGDLVNAQWRWTNITTQGGNSIHPDQHCLAFTPGNSKAIYAGCDGGIFGSSNSGGTWKALNKGLVITEIEYMADDPTTPNWLMAGLQDNGTIRYTGQLAWDHIADGDGGDCGVNQQNPSIIYHSYYGVSLERSTNKGNSWTNLSPPSAAALFYPPVEVAGLTVAIGAASLMVTRSGTGPWTTVPLALSANELPSAIRAIDANTLVIGTTFGRMLRVNWSGTGWSRTALATAAAKYVSCIAVDPSNPQRLWVTSSQISGAGGQVYRSDNGGTSWVNCTAGLPGIPINAVVVDPANFQRVWVAADVGVWQSVDLGAHWAPMSSGLPNAMAVDLVFHRQNRRLFCGTRNRGAWYVDVP